MATPTKNLQQILQAAKRRGAQHAEVFQVSNEETPVAFEANRLKELNSRHTSGVALRVIANGRIGFASSTRPGDVDELAQAALDTAPFGPEAHFDFPTQAEAPVVEVYDPATESVAVDDMVQLGQALIDTVRASEPDLLCQATVRRAIGTVTLGNSNGGGFTSRGSMYSAWVYGTLIRGTDMLFVGDGDASCSPKLDTRAIEATVVQQLEFSRQHAACRSAELPVIFTAPGFASALVGPLIMALNGRLVHQGSHDRMARERARHDDRIATERPERALEHLSVRMRHCSSGASVRPWPASWAW